MKGIFLPGANCTSEIWNPIKCFLSDLEIVYVDYPHAVTKHAKAVGDVTKWVYDTYQAADVDFVVGHSMGGIIALELLSDYGFGAGRVIFIDSNLRPANAFYRNLMLPAHMDQYGASVLAWMRREAEFYGAGLSSSLRDDFDYTSYVKDAPCKIFGIYGDRGQAGYEKRYEDLCLDDGTRKKIEFRFITDACHLPMIENPGMLADVIKECLSA